MKRLRTRSAATRHWHESAYERDFVTNEEVQFRTVGLQPSISKSALFLSLLSADGCKSWRKSEVNYMPLLQKSPISSRFSADGCNSWRKSEVRVVEFRELNCHMYSCVSCLSHLRVF